MEGFKDKLALPEYPDNFEQPGITDEQAVDALKGGDRQIVTTWAHQKQLELEEQYGVGVNRVEAVTNWNILRATVYYRAGDAEYAIEDLRESSCTAGTDEQYATIVDLIARMRAQEAI